MSPQTNQGERPRLKGMTEFEPFRACHSGRIDSRVGAGEWRDWDRWREGGWRRWLAGWRLRLQGWAGLVL